MRVLIVEDDKMFAQLVRRVLEEEGYTVEVAHDLSDGRTLANVNPFDAMVLDVDLPGGSGVNIVRELRARGEPTPILMLTGRREITDKVTTLDAGADDYLTKPVALDELRARMRALLRRGGAQRTEQLALGGVQLDRLTRKVSVDGRDLSLTTKEFALLELFLIRAGQVITRTELLEKVWEMDFDPGSNVVDTHVARLRKKLRERGARLQVRGVRGAGYLLEMGSDDEADAPVTAG